MTDAGERIPCIGCGALVPDTDGPVYAYLDASPGCWELYGQILARKYGEYRYRERFYWLQPPVSLGEVTVVDVLRAEDLTEYQPWVKCWAQSAWEAWTPHHETVRRWAEGGL